VKEMEEGIKVDLLDEKHMSAYISVIVEYGSVIIDVAKNIQSAVKIEIEKNAGLTVKSVDVNILGIQMAKKNAKN
ncbi:MAG TPA: Asp23/Gls24 family envelope stress response protein, partial [Atribacterota bacterium]|nr:Asp23/Gls24 family envelope stress response protein [Atribacterota bacterium]